MQLFLTKYQDAYSQKLEIVLKEWENFKPHSISLDYEMASIKAFSNAFPNALLHGCLFYLVKNIKHHLSSESLFHWYNIDSGFDVQAGMTSALAFASIFNIEEAIDCFQELNEIDNKPNIDESLSPVLDYFEDKYIGRWGEITNAVNPI